jgi:hypothetical protein
MRSSSVCSSSRNRVRSAESVQPRNLRDQQVFREPPRRLKDAPARIDDGG